MAKFSVSVAACAVGYLDHMSTATLCELQPTEKGGKQPCSWYHCCNGDSYTPNYDICTWEAYDNAGYGKASHQNYCNNRRGKRCCASGCKFDAMTLICGHCDMYEDGGMGKK